MRIGTFCLACIIYEGADTKGLICYKHVDETVFA